MLATFLMFATSRAGGFEERHDKRTKGHHYRNRPPADNRGKLNGEVANNLVTSYSDATRILRGSYEETAPWN